MSNRKEVVSKWYFLVSVGEGDYLGTVWSNAHYSIYFITAI